MSKRVLICMSYLLTLNQRVQGSSPCAPTNPFKGLAGGTGFAPRWRVAARLAATCRDLAHCEGRLLLSARDPGLAVRAQSDRPGAGLRHRRLSSSESEIRPAAFRRFQIRVARVAIAADRPTTDFAASTAPAIGGGEVVDRLA
jgi:hypothetical protein